MFNTKYLMMASAVTLGLSGLVVSFTPEEFLGYLGYAAEGPMPELLKLMGGLYLGFAMLNWTAKDNMIGGIYGRPVAIGNFLHYFVGGLTLLKYQVSAGVDAIFTPALVVYAVFAIAFGWLVFGRGAACAVADTSR